MKISHKALTVSLNLLVFFLLTTPNASGKTTLGDSTFPSENGDFYIWRCVNSTGDNHIIGDLTKFIVDFVYNESFEGTHSLIVNYSIEEYDFIGGSWITNQDNVFYMAYNSTLNFLNWSSISYKEANLFLIPIPTNLSLVGEAIESAGFLNYTTDNNKLILDYGNLTTVEITISSLGISTVIESITNGSTVYKWEVIEDDEVIIIVPMGNYFLFFGVLSSSICLLRVKRKLDKKDIIH